MMPTMNFKKGGIASLSLPEMAERVREAGRGDDTMLAHITLEEAGILKLLGGSGTINPKTGQPEFLKKFVKKIVPKEIYNPISSIGKELERGVESIADKLGPVGQIAAAYFGGPIGAALYAGLAPEGSSFDVERAAIAGGLTYGAQQLSPGMGGDAAGGGNAAGTGGPYDISDVGSLGDLGYSAPAPALVPPPTVPSSYDFGAGDIGYAPPPPPPAPVAPSVGSFGVDEMAVPGASTGSPTSMITPEAPIVQASPGMPGAGANAPAPTTTSGIGSLAEAAGETALSYGSRALDYAIANPATTAFVGTQVYAAVEAKKELDRQKEEAERVLAEQEEHTRKEVEFAQDVLRRYPVEYRRLTGEDVVAMGMAAGGLAGLNAFKAGGAMPPRYVKGDGDGMSDSIPARIAGRREARLADSEFVVPADVVSHLGNGSSDAGAKKLYKMMDRVRKARTNTTKQAPEIKAGRYLPA
jgi:ribosomal protein S6